MYELYKYIDIWYLRVDPKLSLGVHIEGKNKVSAREIIETLRASRGCQWQVTLKGSPVTGCALSWFLGTLLCLPCSPWICCTMLCASRTCRWQVILKGSPVTGFALSCCSALRLLPIAYCHIHCIRSLISIAYCRVRWVRGVCTLLSVVGSRLKLWSE